MSSCDEIWVRHNIYEWRANHKWYIRSYTDLTDPSSYIDIEAEMFEDYIRVCGQTSGSNSDKRKGESFSGPQQQVGGRSDRGSADVDEGYERNDGSPTPTTRSLVLVARTEEICHVRLYFSRRKENGLGFPTDKNQSYMWSFIQNFTCNFEP